MKLIGYAPDVDPTIEGVITSCAAVVPSARGMTGAPSAVSFGIAALAAQCYGSASVRKLDNSNRTFAGTLTKLYELASTTWTDRSRAVGGAYTLGVDQFWRFAQFGDTTLAASKTDTLQYSATGAFANVTGAPKADIVETVSNFVFLFNTNEATYGDSPNRWWCSGIRDYTVWTPAISTQCATNTLVSVPGKINAGKRFGEQVVVYKDRGMYLGTYVGAPSIWDFQQVPGDAGCSCQEAVVDIGTPDNPVHIFMGANDFWRFDGSRPVPLGTPLRKTIFAEFNAAFSYRIRTQHDRENSLVYFYYPSNAGGGAIDKCVVYNYRTNAWGRDDRTIEACVEYVGSGLTYDTLDTLYATYNDMPSNISYDSPFWTSTGTALMGIYDTAHTLYALSGVAGNTSFTLGDYGDDTNYYLLSRVKPVWIQPPTSATMVNFHKASEGDSLTTDATTTMSSSRFDLLRSARWHRLQFNMVGDWECSTINAQYQPDGSE